MQKVRMQKIPELDRFFRSVQGGLTHSSVGSKSAVPVADFRHRIGSIYDGPTGAYKDCNEIS